MIEPSTKSTEFRLLTRLVVTSYDCIAASAWRATLAQLERRQARLEKTSPVTNSRLIAALPKGARQLHRRHAVARLFAKNLEVALDDTAFTPEHADRITSIRLLHPGTRNSAHGFIKRRDLALGINPDVLYGGDTGGLNRMRAVIEMGQKQRAVDLTLLVEQFSSVYTPQYENYESTNVTVDARPFDRSDRPASGRHLANSRASEPDDTHVLQLVGWILHEAAKVNFFILKAPMPEPKAEGRFSHSPSLRLATETSFYVLGHIAWINTLQSIRDSHSGSAALSWAARLRIEKDKLLGLVDFDPNSRDRTLLDEACTEAWREFSNQTNFKFWTKSQFAAALKSHQHAVRSVNPELLNAIVDDPLVAAAHKRTEQALDPLAAYAISILRHGSLPPLILTGTDVPELG